MQTGIVFPNQLFEEIPFSESCKDIYLAEEDLFFNQYPFHKQKLAYHRASMKFHAKHLSTHGKIVNYIDSTHDEADVRMLIERLAQKGVKELEIIDVADNWLWKRIRQAAGKHGIIIWDEPVCRRRPDVNQAIHQRKQLPDEDEQLSERELAANMECL